MATYTKRGNQGVVRHKQDCGFYNIFVINCRDGFDNVTVINSKWHATMAVADRWANAHLSEATP